MILDQHSSNNPQGKQSVSEQSHDKKLHQIIVEVAKNQLGMDEAEIVKLLKIKQVNYMLGCFFGALIGDSLGSYCQFMDKYESTSRADNAMKMLGQGPFHLKPGQITDDSEMAIHMLIGLNKYDPKKPLKQQIPLLLVAIGKQYVEWRASNPFDIGLTCSAAIQQIRTQLVVEKLAPTTPQSAQEQYKKLLTAFKLISAANSNSLSNGFLMRNSPLACFVALVNNHKINDMTCIYELIKGQTNMTHSNKIAQQANAMFIQTLVSLITRQEHSQIIKAQQSIQKDVNTRNNQDIIKCAILQAYQSQKNNTQMINSTKSQGFFKIAYFHSYYALRYIAANCKTEADITGQTYKKLLKTIISEGGDTDTNACIAGSLIGSIVGFNKLPKQYLVKMFSLKLHQIKSRPQSKNYQPIKGFINMIKLIKKFI